MIRLEEAHKVIDQLLIPEHFVETIPLENAFGRVLAENIYADADFPSFNKSAMDGYAIKKTDIDKQLKVIEFIPAGKKPEKIIGIGECSRIMTGAMVPDGADMVLMQEDVEKLDDETISVTNILSKENILFKGQDVKAGHLLINHGVRIEPAHIGLMASVGCIEPLVIKKPSITIFSTGDELVSPAEIPHPPQIRNSNTAQLYALVTKLGATANDVGIAKDNLEIILKKIKEALELSDIIILTGGASVGDLDFTGQVFDKLGAKLYFDKLAIQPGKPALLATLGERFLFGLSGNPVSSLVQFELLVKPLINRMLGLNETEKIFKLPMESDQHRKRSERTFFFPVRINVEMEAEALEYHGSAHLHAYHKADGLAEFPIGLNELKKGTLVDVRPF